MTKYSSQAIIDRKPVWSALSDLFLDTDVTLHYDYIVRTCAASPFTIDELEAILKNEVAPVVLPNLYDIAGEWAGFDEDWLVKAICKQGTKNIKPHQKLRVPLGNLGLRDYTGKHWLAIGGKIAEFRKNTVAKKNI